jgi:hypothetical protein
MKVMVLEKKAVRNCRIEIRLVPLGTGQNDFSVYILISAHRVYIHGDGSA